MGLAGLLAACGGGGGGTATTATGDGALRVALTDAPSCGYDHVFVTVEKVRVHTSTGAADGEAGWREIVVSPARRIDLLALTNGVLEELGTTPLPAGRYSQVRLVLAENGGATPMANAVQATGSAAVALDTPSAQQSGLKLQTQFDVAAGQTADLVLDFDACKSIVKRGNSGRYNLKPVVSVFQRASASIEGYVTTTLVIGSTTVSAQQNGTTVRATVPDASGKFVLPYLAEGTYTLAVVSEGRSTAVVTGVPVSLAAGKTLVSGTATAITPPISAMREASGMVSVSTTGTATVGLADARVRALQVLTGGPTVEVASQTVDADLATYRFRLPVAAPIKAAYQATGPLSFATDTAVAAKYTLQASSTGRTSQDRAIDLATGDALLVNFLFAP